MSLPAPAFTVENTYVVQFDDGTFLRDGTAFRPEDGPVNESRTAESAAQKLAGQEYLMSQGIRPRRTGGRVIRRVTTTAVSWEEEPFDN